MEPISSAAPALPGRIVLRQFWADLVFVHWRASPNLVAPLLPRGIVPDVFDGDTWVGLIPFRMLDSAPLGGPAIPYFGSFTEVNVRLYGVDAQGRRGVLFVSLEASRLAAVLTARSVFGLPYFWANATHARTQNELRYESHRVGGAQPSSVVVAQISQIPVVDEPLAEFLTARWRLFAARGSRTYVQANSHAPWPLFEATLVSLDDDLLSDAGFPGLADRVPDSVLYSPGVLTAFSGPQRLTQRQAQSS